MGVQKRGQVQSAGNSPSHRWWLISGVVLVAVLVLAIFLLSPARQALFGKAGFGAIPGTPADNGIARTCMDVQLLPPYHSPSKLPTQTQIRTSTFSRQDVCESARCTFSGIDGSPSGRDTTKTTQNSGNDFCSGIPANCPDVSRYGWRGGEYEAGRRMLCEAQDCIFTSGGDDSAQGDSCTPEPAPAIDELAGQRAAADSRVERSYDALRASQLDEKIIETDQKRFQDQMIAIKADAHDAIYAAGSIAEIDSAVSRAENSFAGISAAMASYASRAQGCSNNEDDDKDGLVDCADSDCREVEACAWGETDPARADITGDGVIDSNDITQLLYILRAVGEDDCGGSGQQVCDYSDDYLFVCDGGMVYEMESDEDRTHENEVCGSGLQADVTGDGIIDSNDVTQLLYVLRAVGEDGCGGSGQQVCDYSDDYLFVCDDGMVYEMESDDDRAHENEICS